MNEVPPNAGASDGNVTVVFVGFPAASYDPTVVLYAFPGVPGIPSAPDPESVYDVDSVTSPFLTVS